MGVHECIVMPEAEAISSSTVAHKVVGARGRCGRVYALRIRGMGFHPEFVLTNAFRMHFCIRFFYFWVGAVAHDKLQGTKAAGVGGGAYYKIIWWGWVIVPCPHLCSQLLLRWGPVSAAITLTGAIVMGLAKGSQVGGGSSVTHYFTMQWHNMLHTKTNQKGEPRPMPPPQIRHCLVRS